MQRSLIRHRKRFTLSCDARAIRHVDTATHLVHVTEVDAHAHLRCRERLDDAGLHRASRAAIHSPMTTTTTAAATATAAAAARPDSALLRGNGSDAAQTRREVAQLLGNLEREKPPRRHRGQRHQRRGVQRRRGLRTRREQEVRHARVMRVSDAADVRVREQRVRHVAQHQAVQRVCNTNGARTQRHAVRADVARHHRGSQRSTDRC